MPTPGGNLWIPFQRDVKEPFVFSSGTLIFTAIVFLLIGGAAGAALFNKVRSQAYSREMEQRVKDAEATLKNYQQEVAEHFAQTSELVNDLTQSYRNVHEHLARSALKLATPAISRQIIEAAKEHHLLSGDSTYADETSVEPPRDWAPRGEKGALAEDYGLHDHEEAPTDPTTETEVELSEDVYTEHDAQQR